MIFFVKLCYFPAKFDASCPVSFVVYFTVCQLQIFLVPLVFMYFKNRLCKCAYTLGLKNAPKKRAPHFFPILAVVYPYIRIIFIFIQLKAQVYSRLSFFLFF